MDPHVTTVKVPTIFVHSHSSQALPSHEPSIIPWLPPTVLLFSACSPISADSLADRHSFSSKPGILESSIFKVNSLCTGRHFMSTRSLESVQTCKSQLREQYASLLGVVVPASRFQELRCLATMIDVCGMGPLYWTGSGCSKSVCKRSTALYMTAARVKLDIQRVVTVACGSSVLRAHLGEPSPSIREDDLSRAGSLCCRHAPWRTRAEGNHGTPSTARPTDTSSTPCA